jgi:ankyrin repeat protein
MRNHFIQVSMAFFLFGMCTASLQAQDNGISTKKTTPPKAGKSMTKEALNQALLEAVDAADLTRIQSLLKQGASANTKTPQGKTLMTLLFEKAYLERPVMEKIANLLIDSGADIRVVAGLNMTYLHHSAGYNLVSTVKKLLDKGIDTTIKAVPGGGTANFYANSADVAKLLIKNRPGSINDVDEYGNSLLHNACSVKPSLELVQYYSKTIPIEKVNNKGQTPLMVAVDWKYASEEREKVIEFLIAQKANVNVLDKKQRSLLMIALSNTAINASLIKHILAGKPDINLKDTSGNQAIHYAAVSTLDNFKLIDKAGADLNTQTLIGETPLIVAVNSKNTPVVEYLITRHIDVNKTDRHGKTALNYALEFDMGDIVALLQQAKAMASTEGQIAKSEQIYLKEEEAKSHEVHDMTDAIREKDLGAVKTYLSSMQQTNTINQEALDDALFFAVQSGSLEIFQYFLEKGADIHAVDEEEYNLLHEAVFRDRLDIVKYLIDKGFDINTAKPDTHSVLRMATISSLPMIEYLISNGLKLDKKWDGVKYAIQYSNPAVARYLIKQGFSFNKDLLNKDNFLVEVFKSGKPEILTFLVENGMDINKPLEFHRDQAPPLYYALVFKNKDMALALINAGATLTGRDGNRDAIFMYVINSGNLDVVNAYYDRGASLADTTGIFNDTPLSVAFDLQRVQIIQSLIKRGANVNEHNKLRGDTPLHHAARLGYVQTAKLLINKGADIKALNNDKQTPLDTAIKFEQNAMAELLRKAAAQ